MKKYITIAALLAAGTTFANAETLELTTPSGGTLTSSNAALAWDTNGGLLEELSSWEVSFDLTVTRDALENQDLATICGSWKFAINANGTVEFYGDDLSYNSESWGILPKTETNIVVSFISNIDQEGNSLGTGTFYAKSGDNEFSVEVEKVFAITSGDTGKCFRLWTNSAKEHYSNITVSKLADNVVPDPSACGLLAGLGALALVASRRRRK